MLWWLACCLCDVVSVDDLDSACEWLEQQQGVMFKKRPQEGSMRTLAFCYDPDGYWVEVIQRGFTMLE